MITIDKSIVQQIQRSMEIDPRYIAKLVKRMPENIRSFITLLFTQRYDDRYALLCHCFDDGFENFQIKDSVPDDYMDQVERVNPELHDFIVLESFLNNGAPWGLLIIYRLFESEHEIRSI